MDVGTLPNHDKSCVSWLCGDCLLVVDLLSFHCRVSNSVLLCCLIGDISLTFLIKIPTQLIFWRYSGSKYNNRVTMSVHLSDLFTEDFCHRLLFFTAFKKLHSSLQNVIAFKKLQLPLQNVMVFKSFIRLCQMLFYLSANIIFC